MVVGEPSLMGGEFGDEDERLITRLENTQYDSTNSLDHENHGGFGHADSPITGPSTWNVDSEFLYFSYLLYQYQSLDEYKKNLFNNNNSL